MNTNKVRTSDTDDDDEQVGNEGVSSGEETRKILGSVVKAKTDRCSFCSDQLRRRK